MFVKQIEMKEALRLAADGQEVMLLAPSTPTPENWMEYYPDTLQGFLEGCMYFRRELAMTNPEFEAVVQNMVSEDAAKTAAEPTEPQQDRSEESAEPSEGGPRKALRQCGCRCQTEEGRHRQAQGTAEGRMEHEKDRRGTGHQRRQRVQLPEEAGRGRGREADCKEREGR